MPLHYLRLYSVQGLFMLLLLVVESRNCLWPEEKLSINNCLRSKDYVTSFSACLTEKGSLCVSSSKTTIWCTNTSSPIPSHAGFDSTGSFNLYDQNGDIYCTLYQSSNTVDERNSYMIMQPDGNLIIYPDHEDTTELPKFYECKTAGCQTLHCQDCQDALCTNHKDSSKGRINYTIILYIVIPLGTAFLSKIIYALFFDQRQKDDDTPIDDIPTLAEVQIINTNPERVYEPISVEIESSDDLNDNVVALVVHDNHVGSTTNV